MKMTKGKVICGTRLHNVVYLRFWESRWLEAANFHLFAYEKISDFFSKVQIFLFGAFSHPVFLQQSYALRPVNSAQSLE